MRAVFVLLAAAIIVGGCGRAKDQPAGVPPSDDPGVIVFTGGPVRAIRPDGTGVRPFQLREACEPTAFSRDGQMVACWPPPGGALGFYVMRRDGSDFHEVPVPGGNSHSPSFSPDGKQVAFVYSRGEYGDASELWMAGLDGEEAHELAPGPNASPEWSPDGDRIAFIRTEDRPAGCLDGGNLVIIGADGGEEQVVISDAEGPEWSPDGKRLAFVRRMPARSDADEDQNGTCALWIAAIGGGSPVLLARDVFEASLFEMAWSPDGSQIAFLTEESCPLACNVRVSVVPSTGGEPRTIGPVIGETATLYWLPSSAISAEPGGKVSR